MNQNVQTFNTEDDNNANDDVYLRNAALMKKNWTGLLCYLTTRCQ